MSSQFPDIDENLDFEEHVDPLELEPGQTSDSLIESLLISMHASEGDLDRLPTGMHMIDMTEDQTDKQLRVLKWEETLQPILQMTTPQQLSQVLTFFEIFLPIDYSSYKPTVDTTSSTPSTISSDIVTCTPISTTTSTSPSPSTSTTSSLAQFSLSTASCYHRDFITKSDKNCQRMLGLLGYASGMIKQGDESILVLYRSGRRLTITAVADIVHDLYLVFAYPGIFDYQMILERMVQAVGEVIEKHCPYLDTCDEKNSSIRDAVKQIKICHTAVSGEEFMIPYEISFEANMAAKQIAYPNINQLGPKHLTAMLSRFDCASLGPLFRRFYRSCIRIPCHEVIHCIQSVAAQIDCERLSWSAEHDASYVCESMMWEVSRLSSMSDLFPPGLVEEVAMDSLSHAHKLWSTWNDDVKQQYLTWRDSFGKKAPSSSIDEDTASGFKALIAVECCQHSSHHLQQQLDLLFKNRTGDVYATSIVVPDEIRITPGQSALARWTSTSISTQLQANSAKSS